MRLLLDTVTFIWAVSSPDRISKRAMQALQHEKALRQLSSISLVEIAIKQSKGKLIFSKNDLITGASDLKLQLLSYSADHAFQLYDLPLHHFDPFDRQLIAQAIVENIPIVTPDEKFRLYEGVKLIW